MNEAYLSEKRYKLIEEDSQFIKPTQNKNNITYNGTAV